MLKTVQLIVGVVQSICTDDVENSANLFNAIIIVIISQVTLNFKDEMTILTQEQPAVKKKKKKKLSRPYGISKKFKLFLSQDGIIFLIIYATISINWVHLKTQDFSEPTGG